MQIVVKIVGELARRGGGSVAYNIDYLIRTNRRSISISIDQNCKLIVRAPRKVPFAQIQALVEKREDWIRLHLEKIQSTQKLNYDIAHYREIMFCGRLYHITFDENAHKINLVPDYCVVPAKFQETLVQQLTKWLKKVAWDVLLNRVEYFCTLMQLQPQKIRLTNARTCWGVCNSAGVVSLNWRLILLPHDLIDYVVVHELAHLVQMNHSKLFWELVKSVLPDYALRRKNLHQGDYLLNLYR